MEKALKALEKLLNMWNKVELKNAEKYFIMDNFSLSDAYQKICENSERSGVVINTKHTMLGTITMGDFKRKIGYELSSKIIANSTLTLQEVMNKDFLFVAENEQIDKNCNHLIVPRLTGGKIASLCVKVPPSEEIKIGKTKIGEDQPTFVISEIGVNHDGDINLAKRLITDSKNAGANCVKFQHRSLKHTYVDQNYSSGSELSTESTIDHLKKVNLSLVQLEELFSFARELGIEPLCTPFDLVSLAEVLSLKPAAIKIASADLLNFELVKAAAITELPLILSTGMHNEEEIISAVTFARLFNKNLIVLHCISTYPASPGSLNLGYLPRLKKLSGCLVGYSSHDNGNLASLIAASMGAVVIEKHITGDRSSEGPDHNASSEYKEFKDLCQDLSSLSVIIGSKKVKTKSLSQGEKINRSNLSKSLYANVDIPLGKIIAADDLICRSPGVSIPCSNIKFVVGQKAKAEVKKYSPIFTADVFADNEVWRRVESSPLNSNWGIAARFRDVNQVLSQFNPKFVEFHLTYSDLNFKKIASLNLGNVGVKVHTPELFENNFLLDLASNDKSVLKKSIDYMRRTIEISHEIYENSDKSTALHLVINVGGHSDDDFLAKEKKKSLFEALLKSFQLLDFGKCIPCIQSMPPFPWHLGGRRFHNLFVEPEDFKFWNDTTGIEFCLDFSHTFLSAKHLRLDFDQYIESVLPYSNYFHIADSSGSDGEGLQIGSGEIDFRKIIERQLKGHEYEYIPEIWEGHLNKFEGFKVALKKLQLAGW